MLKSNVTTSCCDGQQDFQNYKEKPNEHNCEKLTSSTKEIRKTPLLIEDIRNMSEQLLFIINDKEKKL